MTTLYLDLEGGSDTLKDDSSGAPHTLTKGGAAAISISTYKFDGASLSLSSSNSSMLTESSTDFNVFGGSPTAIGCFECWFYVSTYNTSPHILQFGSSITSRMNIYASSTNLIFYSEAGGSGANRISTSRPSTGSWHHVALDYDGTTFTMYVDGTSVGTSTTTNFPGYNNAGLALTLSIGTQQFSPATGDYFNGFVDEVVVWKGYRPYTANFTPPSAPYNSSDAHWANIKFLYHAQEVSPGRTFDKRFKSIPAASAAAVAGDTVRCMSSPGPTLVGNATWTQNSRTITLAGAVTVDIATCDSAWTAVTNVTATTSSANKEGTNAASIAIAAAFTTGKAAYFATGTLDLSAYQQVSFWVRPNATVAANTLSLRLCTDTTGDVSVHTIPIPAIANSSGVYAPVTVDLGANLNSAIKSVALYQDSDIAAVTLLLDNIIACKASSSADALTLTNLIGKVWNLSWAASSTYSTNDIRTPTTSNRNGYRYKVTAGGGSNSGGSEPTWPQEVGKTVTDGSLTWTCEGLEDTWYSINSIRGTTVIIDQHINANSSGGRGYAGATETVATYRRVTIKSGQQSGSDFSSGNNVQTSGSAGSLITFSGGWDRTNMSSQTGQTWLDGENGYGAAIGTNSKSYISLNNFGFVRHSYVLFNPSTYWELNFCHAVTLGYLNTGGGYGVMQNSSTANLLINGCNFSFNSTHGLHNNNPSNWKVQASSFNSNQGIGVNFGAYPGTFNVLDVVAKNNGTSGLNTSSRGPLYASGLITGGNGSYGIGVQCANVFLTNCSIPESTKYDLTGYSGGTNTDYRIFSQKDGQAAGVHVVTTDGGTISSATDQRHTASGISWKFRPTSTSRNQYYPLPLSVGKVLCTANTAVNVTIWTRRDNTNIQGRLRLPGGQIAGANQDTVVNCAPAINTWTQSSTLTFTPTESGVVELFFEVWDGVGTSNSYWIDDIAFS
jgi:hypothetical protein